MEESLLNKPVIFFGKLANVLFAGILSIPVWLAAHTYMEGIAIHDDEAVATGVTICFFVCIFSGRYIAQAWALYKRSSPRKLIVRLAVFIAACMCILVLHIDFPFAGTDALNLLLSVGPFIAMSFAAGTLIKVVRSSAEDQINAARRAAVHSESELRLLQSQLSPHFLFNTLNNMYGLSLKQQDKLPSLLLKLSELLRYSVYGSNEAFVPLKNEIGHINNYIDFEKIRLGERLELAKDIDLSASDNVLIAPMLLIVFIENAFKHSKNTIDDKIFIDIKLQVWNGQVLFSVKNSHSRREKQFDKNSGFGLSNVKKRLELIYPGEYDLNIEEDERTYSVTLQIKNRKL